MAFYKFNNITIHNFASFGDTSFIDFTDKGYCVITGVNRYAVDCSLSNGAGKSTISNALCWCLTGETLQGVTTDVENRNLKQGCYVSLSFNVDNDSYVVTRYRNDPKFKTDLKIVKNGKDISGSGISKSSIVLADELPGLDRDLISSVVLLGQGLPNSLTKFSPKGRKELLERLTKSDFMIQDVKERLKSRQAVINEKLRNIDLELASLNGQLEIKVNNKKSLEGEYDQLNTSIDYDSAIDELNKKLKEVQELIPSKMTGYTTLNSKLKELNDGRNQLYTESVNEKEKVTYEYNNSKYAIMSKHKEIEMNLSSCQSQLNRIINLPGICPTCGQPIPETKRDTSEIELLIEKNTKALKEIEQELATLENNYRINLDKVKQVYDEKLVDLDKSINSVAKEVSELFTVSNELQSQAQQYYNEVTRLTLERDNHYNNLEKIKNKIAELETSITEDTQKIVYNNGERELISNRLQILSKIDSLVKRDFRGYLLENIIAFIRDKAQEFARYIFPNSSVDICLSGNDIDITLNDKDFGTLSGGEKQKVDIILQLAIRSMMSSYVNFQSNILFLDEITDNLDSVGCDGLFNLITNTLNDIESVFIISHHESELSIPNDSTIVVEKDANGISKVI